MAFNPTGAAPGVYVIDTTPQGGPIAGVSTSVAGFIGVAPDNANMPAKVDGIGAYKLAKAEEPILITSWVEFRNNFGDFESPPAPAPVVPAPVVPVVPAPLAPAPVEPTESDARKYLQHAVNGFFLNGGSRCWVIRVPKWTDLKSGLKSLLEKFAPIDEISMIVVPGLVTGAEQLLVTAHCEEMKDRVAILDGKNEWQPTCREIRHYRLCHK